MRRLYKYRRGMRVRKVVAFRSFTYRGFKITIVNNKAYSFKYEWRVSPIGPTSLRLTRRKGKFHRIIYDPTSMPNIKATIEYARIQVHELRRPFWYRR